MAEAKYRTVIIPSKRVVPKVHLKADHAHETLCKRKGEIVLVHRDVDCKSCLEVIARRTGKHSPLIKRGDKWAINSK